LLIFPENTTVPQIIRVRAREVLDSRGQPTVEAEIDCDDGSVGRAIVPSGASTGTAEACELRDRDPARYDGRGVLKAVANVNTTIADALAGLDPREQTVIDARLIELDGTPQKTRLGANALLAASLAAAHAAAASEQIPLYRHIGRLMDPTRACGALLSGTPTGPWPLAPGPFPQPFPVPMTNMISGGLHAGGNLDFQDFLIVPHGATDYSTGLEWTVRVYRRLGTLLREAGYEGFLVGDEGGYGPRLQSNRQAAEFVVRAIQAAGLRPAEDVSLAIDVAATHFFDGEFYRLAATGNDRLTSEQMIDQLEALVDDFPILSVEDGLADEDWEGWRRLTARLGGRVRLIGDDLFATNPKRLARGIQLGAGNSVLIKVNQIGTLTETLETMQMAAAAGFTRVVSARSGETEDTTIADLAAGAGAEQIKIGSIVRSERLAKYNRLLRIAEELQEGQT